jgi:DNA-binding transcriptional ArsR family regulator
MNRNVDAEPDLSFALASVAASPSRAAILEALMGGQALPASELAYRAGVTNQTASGHLAKLEAAGLVVVRKTGRHRYYALTGPAVADSLEMFMQVAPAAKAPRLPRGMTAEMRTARMCYDHLAGMLGVAVTSALERRGDLAQDGDDFALTPRGEDRLLAFGVDIAGARKARRAFARQCVDWSERRPHIAGALGAAIAHRLIDLGWVRRHPDNRSLTLPDAGRVGLCDAFEIAPKALEARAGD